MEPILEEEEKSSTAKSTVGSQHGRSDSVQSNDTAVDIAKLPSLTGSRSSNLASPSEFPPSSSTSIGAVDSAGKTAAHQILGKNVAKLGGASPSKKDRENRDEKAPDDPRVLFKKLASESKETLI